jgi:CrcB protein
MNRWQVCAVVAAGGIAGTLARYGVQHIWPHPPGGFAWSTFAINVGGSACLGVLMPLIRHRRLLRALLGVGVLGGFTTFSGYLVDIQQSDARVAPLYLAGTLVAALVAIWLADALTNRAIRWSRR